MNMGLSGLFGANMINFYFSEKSSHSYAFTKLIIAVYKLVCCSLCVCVCASVCVCTIVCVCVCTVCVTTRMTCTMFAMQNVSTVEAIGDSESVCVCVCMCVYCVCDQMYDMYDVCHAECLDSGSHRGE